MTRKIRRLTSVQVTAEFDVDDVLGEVPTEQLREELRGRDEREGYDMIKEMIMAMEPMLRAGDVDGALAWMHRWRGPKFESVEDCQKAFDKSRSTPDRQAA